MLMLFMILFLSWCILETQVCVDLKKLASPPLSAASVGEGPLQSMLAIIYFWTISKPNWVIFSDNCSLDQSEIVLCTALWWTLYHDNGCAKAELVKQL